MASESQLLTINDFIAKVKTLKVTDVNEINLVLDQFNSLHYINFFGDREVFSPQGGAQTEYGELLCSLANLIPPKNDHLLHKFCSLIISSLYQRRVVLLRPSQDCLLDFSISAVQSCAHWVCSDALWALHGILENHSDYNEKYKDVLIGENGVLTKFLETNFEDKKIQYVAFACLFTMLNHLEENSLDPDLLNFSFKYCFLVLKDKPRCNMETIQVLKVFYTCLRCLQCVFTSKNIKVENFGEMLGTLKNLLFYGLPGQNFTQDTNLYPTLRYPETSLLSESKSESDSPYPKLRKQKKNKRRQKKTPQKNAKATNDVPPVEEVGCGAADASEGIANLSLSSSKFSPEAKVRSSSSDSEPSDTDYHGIKIRYLQGSLRENAYLVLQEVVKVSDKKLIFGYWSYFLPEHPMIHGLVSSPNIFTTILKDPESEVRLGALGLLAEMLRGSKQFLIHADGRNARHLSFTSLSSILATMIGEIHRNLLLALLSENSSLLLIQVLKCYAVLSENVPYCKLDPDILLKFLKHVKNYLTHKDIQVRVACLAVFCSVLNSDQIPADIAELMLSSDFDSVVNGRNSVGHNSPSSCAARQSPWIVQLCKNNILGEEPLPIKIQCLQLLSSVVGKYFQKTSCFFEAIENIVLFCLNNPDTSIQLHGAKLLDIFGRSINISTNAEVKKSLEPLISALWQSVLMGSFIKCLTNDEVKTLQSVCCDCLSTLSSNDFERLQPKQQIMYITVLLGLASDSNPNVRGAAIRCLGLFCLFPSLNQDATFLDDVSVILIKSVEDPNVNVRFKASWSLGNLSDALFVNKDLLNKEISCKFFYSIGMACVRFSQDCDRVKANAVRALGNLLSYIPEQFLGVTSMQEFIKESCEALKSALSSGFMKVCWNSCYALSSMLKNTHLIERCDLNLNEVLSCLLKVLKSPNFKVRISATQALTTLKSRALYGCLFPVIWQDLVSALYSALSDVNFKEIKHQENLHDQLCFSLCQLAALITLEDIAEVKDCILCSQEMLLISMWKYGSRLPKEKSSVVYSTIDKLSSLQLNSATNLREDPTLTSLLDVLNQAHIAFLSQDVS